MIVSDLTEMEDIVNSNPLLSWDGWDVVQLIQDDYAEFLATGFFDRKTLQWYRKTVFHCTENGWDIPELVK